MSNLCPNCKSFSLEDFIWWVSRRKGSNKWWCAICGEKYDWKQPNRLLVVQTGGSIDQAKFFKAHAALQGLRANLINAFRMPVNQQEDGDGLIQNILTNLGKGSRKGLTGDSREFIKIDSERALEVGYMNPGMPMSRWGHPLVDYDWHAFCQALYKGIEGEDWGEMCEAYKGIEQGGGG